MRILFVCTGNSFRSPLAEALARKFHPDLEVESAGIQAVEEISENTKKFLKAENALKYLKPSPDQISGRALKEADKIVLMMPHHKKFVLENFEVEDKELEVWKVKDPINSNIEPEEAFEVIKAKTLNLF